MSTNLPSLMLLLLPLLLLLLPFRRLFLHRCRRPLLHCHVQADAQLKWVRHAAA